MIWQDSGQEKPRKHHMLRTHVRNGGRKVIPPRRFRGINSCCNTNCKLPCKFIMIVSININFFIFNIFLYTIYAISCRRRGLAQPTQMFKTDWKV